MVMTDDDFINEVYYQFMQFGRDLNDQLLAAEKNRNGAKISLDFWESDKSETYVKNLIGKHIKDVKKKDGIAQCVLNNDYLKFEKSLSYNRKLEFYTGLVDFLKGCLADEDIVARFDKSKWTPPPKSENKKVDAVTELPKTDKNPIIDWGD